MAVTLGAELLAAQTAASRRPIIELIAGKAVSDYPFLGNAIANGTDQALSWSAFLPSGGYAIFYASGGSLRYIATDPDRTEFSNYVNTVSTALTYLDGVALGTGWGLAVVRSATNLTFYRVNAAGALLGTTSITVTTAINGAAVTATATGYACITTRISEGVSIVELRTSTDFITWSAATILTIPTLDTARPIKDPRLHRLADGTYVLVLVYATAVIDETVIYNVLFSTSADLTTWSTPEPITNTSAANQAYVRPSIIEMDDGTVRVSVQEENRYLQMTKSTTGWDNNHDLIPYSVWVNETTRKLYALSFYRGYGPKGFRGMAQIDIDTWSIDRFFDQNTTPALSPAFTEAYNNNSHHSGEGVLACFGANHTAAVINFQTDAITHYQFTDQVGTYGVEFGTKNTNFPASMTDWGISCTFIRDNKLWCGINHGSWGNFNNRPKMGYIDLAQTSPPYDFVLVNEYNNVGGTLPSWRHHVFPDEDICMAPAEWGTDNWEGFLHVGIISTGVLLKDYRRSQGYQEFPRAGFFAATLVGDRIFATVVSTGKYPEEHYKWGLAEIDMMTDQIIYHYPPWATGRGNWVVAVERNPERYEIVMNGSSGFATYNYITGVWSRTAPATHPGVPTISAWRNSVAYDNVTDSFFGGATNRLYLVPRDGTANIMKFRSADPAAAWALGALTTLVSGFRNRDLQLAVSPEQETYATWTNFGASPDEVRWDKDAATLNLAPYLTGETVWDEQMDAPGRLSLTLSHGHLFDPRNASSLLNVYIRKGRLISCRLGEKVSGVSYWTNHGEYLVRSLDLSFQRGEYPLAAVVAEDVRCLWDQHRVIVVDVANQTPEAALSSIVTTHTPMLAGDITVPALPGSFAFDAQWLEQYLSEIVDDIANRFQHFPVINRDGNLTFRRITASGTSTRTVGKAEIVTFRPDDRFSDLTNRITVRGQSLYDFQVLHAEERIGDLNGTVGWWGFRKDFTVYYSDDKARRCKYPRLEVTETSTSILFKLAGNIRESITTIDPYDKYCVIEVKAPNLIPLLLTAIGIYFAGSKVGDIAPIGGGITIPVGRYIESTGLMLALMVLGSIGNYQYEIHGQPVGYVKRTYSADADDTELQQELGMIVRKAFDGFLCYTHGHCQSVADFEMTVTKGQRNRVTVNKIANLRDELGDTLSITHPYTAQLQRVFITGLRRKYLPAVDGTGHFLDDLEGWAV